MSTGNVVQTFKIGDYVRTPNGVFQIKDIDDHDFIEGVVDDIQLYFTDKNERWEWSNNCTRWELKGE
jgi:small-conductance mechanosensitive channel